MGLSPGQLESFETEGWLLVKDVIPHRLVHALQDEIDAAVDRQAQALLEEGKITEPHADKGYLTRLEHIFPECREIWNPVHIAPDETVILLTLYLHHY